MTGPLVRVVVADRFTIVRRQIVNIRGREAVQLIAEGRINKQIGKTLDVSVKTVECHRASAMRKLELRTTADLVRYAVRNDMIQA